MHNNPITPAILQTALILAQHLGAQDARGRLAVTLARENADMHGTPAQHTAVLLHWIHCRNLEIERQHGDAETAYNPLDNAAAHICAWALAGAWNAVYRRENVIADYLFARMVQYNGNGDVSQESPLSPNAAFDSILPPELRMLLDRIAGDETESA